MRIFFGILLVLGTYFGANFLLNQKIPQWRESVSEIVNESTAFSFERLQNLKQKSQEELPSFYPFSSVQSVFGELENIFLALEDIKKTKFSFSEKSVEISSVWAVLDCFKNIENPVAQNSQQILPYYAVHFDSEAKLKSVHFLKKTVS